jgi:adenylate cyclase
MTGGATRTIMVAEDDQPLRDLMEDQLGALGYLVVPVGSAEDALAALEAAVPDLVITDVHMPGRSGIELCRIMKADPRFRLVPVIVVTAVADLHARVSALGAGADDFFAKPWAAIELATRVRALLRVKDLQDELAARNDFLRTVFGRYVSDDVVADVVANPADHLHPGGRRCEATVLFADLRGFTPLSETLEPEDVLGILNVYLGHVVDAVLELGGMLDKFRGDGVMAVFGAPVTIPDHARRAVHCALAIQERVAGVVFEEFDGYRPQVGIGINTGAVVAGNVGSERRMDYTVIGNEVNIAQRFEASAGPGQILISGTTYEHVRDEVQVRELGAFRVKGKKRGVPVFDVLGLRAAAR